MSTCGILLQLGADTNAVTAAQAAPLHFAAAGNMHDICKLLIHWDADVNAPTSFGSTPADIAERKQHGDLVAHLRSGLGVKSVPGRAPYNNTANSPKHDLGAFGPTQTATFLEREQERGISEGATDEAGAGVG